MSAPPVVLVTVEVLDECWLIFDGARGHWTLRRAGAVLSDAADRVLPSGSMLTLLWPEPR